MLLAPSPNDDAQSAPPLTHPPPPQTSPPSPHPFPPPCALFNEDSPMQLKILASCCYCMTNTATVIPHGLSFLLQEAEEMEKYTRVPVARETDRKDCESVFVCV